MLVLLFFVARWLAGRIVRPMQQAYEAQRRFISDAGHELKTPVAVMEANAELLQREVGDNPWLARRPPGNRQTPGAWEYSSRSSWNLPAPRAGR